MSPIRNTSLFLRLHAATIQESNLEHLLVFKIPHGMIHKSNPEQLLDFKFHAGTIRKTNLEQLLVFKAPRRNDPQVQSNLVYIYI